MTNFLPVRTTDQKSADEAGRSAPMLATAPTTRMDRSACNISTVRKSCSKKSWRSVDGEDLQKEAEEVCLYPAFLATPCLFLATPCLLPIQL